MVKCVKCGTAWTSSGMPLCPFCGTRVEDSAAATTAQKPSRRPDPVSAMSFGFSNGSAGKSSNGTALLEAPPEPQTFEAAIPLEFEAVEAECSLSPQLERIEPAPVKPPKPVPMPLPDEDGPPPDVAAKTGMSQGVGMPVMPAPARPLNGPLILGLLALVPVMSLPWTLAFEGTQVMGILGFCMTGFFAPFAPIAWMVGLSAEERRREQGLRLERRVFMGRLLGQGATLILFAEFSAGLIGIAVLRLSGMFPGTFWM